MTVSGGSMGGGRNFGARNHSVEPEQNGSYGNRGVSNLIRLAGQVMQNSKASNAHGQQSDPSDGFRGYSYNEKKNEGIFGSMFQDNQAVTDEQYRADVIDQASLKGFDLYQALHNRTGIYYQQTKDAVERFKRDRQGNVVQFIEPFTNEVENNIALYRYLASYSCTLFVSDLVTFVFNGTVDQIVSDPKKQLALLHNNFFTMLHLQFLSWLEGHPDALMIINQMSPAHKAYLENIEGGIDAVQAKLLGISIGNAAFAFPWKKGTLRRITETKHVRSPLLDGYDFYNSAQEGSFGSYEAPHNVGKNNPHQGAYDTLQQLINANNNNVHVKPGRSQSNYGWDDEQFSSHNESSVDSKIELLQRMTFNNRGSYNFSDYFVKVPGLENTRYLCDPEHFRYICRSLTLRTDSKDKPTFDRVYDVRDVIPLIRIDWNEGLYDYELIPTQGEDMLTILTNPDKVLPGIKGDDREAARAAFDQYIKETSDIVDDENKPVSIPQCQKLEKEPKMLFGNRPIEVSSNDEITTNLENLSGYYDPNKTLDGLGLSFTIKNIYQLDPDFNGEDIYKLFPNLVNGKCNSINIKEFHREVKSGLSRLESEELGIIIRNHLTNVANRWLVECRFYSEDPQDPSYLKFDDFIEDCEYFFEYVNERDRPTMESFFNLTKNDFLRENFTMFANPEERMKTVDKEVKKCEDEMQVIRAKVLESAIVFQRDLMVVKVNPMTPLAGFKRVALARSAIPSFDRTIEVSEEKSMKHFGRPVQVLTTFDKDVNARYWTVSKSEFDHDVKAVRQLNSLVPMSMLKIAK